MKFQVKTTALAILVSLGVVACTSNNDSNHNQPTQPTPVKTESSTTDVDKKKAEEEEAKKEEAKKAEAERLAAEKAKAEAEAKAKAEEAKRLEEERKKAEADAKKLADAKAKAEAEAKAKAAAEAKAKADAEAKRKAEEAKRLEEERKKAEAEAKRLAEEKAKADAEAKRKAEEAKKLAEEKAKADAEAKRLEEERKRKEAEAAEKNKAVNLLDKNGVEWRQVTLSDEMHHPSKSVLVFKSTNYRKGRINDHTYDYDYSNTTVKSPFDRDVVHEEPYWINLNAESAKDGKPFIGSHQGSIKGNFRGEVVKSVEIDRSLDNPRILTKGNVTQINYLYVNQPYSSYGFLFTPEDNQSQAFVVVQPAKHPEVKDNNYHVAVRDEVVSGSPTGRLIWNDGIAGDATYKGNLIAAYSEEPRSKDLVGTEKVLAPHVDGTITINAHFGNTWDKTKVSGEIDSKILGKDTFTNVNIDLNTLYGHKDLGNHRFYTDKTGSEMRVSFAGPQLTEAVGSISYHNFTDSSVIKSYEAVFGATKQPK